MNTTYIVKLQMVRDKEIQYDTSIERNTPKELWALAREIIGDSDKEILLTICMDGRYHITAIDITSIGTVDASLAVPRDIFKTAILSNASRIAIAHNHPSGRALPSRADDEVVKAVKAAGKVIGIQLADSLIVTSDGYFSYVEAGRMDIF